MGSAHLLKYPRNIWIMHRVSQLQTFVILLLFSDALAKERMYSYRSNAGRRRACRFLKNLVSHVYVRLLLNERSRTAMTLEGASFRPRLQREPPGSREITTDRFLVRIKTWVCQLALLCTLFDWYSEPQRSTSIKYVFQHFGSVGRVGRILCHSLDLVRSLWCRAGHGRLESRFSTAPKTFASVDSPLEDHAVGQ